MVVGCGQDNKLAIRLLSYNQPTTLCFVFLLVQVVWELWPKRLIYS